MKKMTKYFGMLKPRIIATGMNIMPSANIKDAAHQLMDQLDHLTWAELAYQATVKASIEQGLEEAKSGKLISQNDIEKEFGIRR